MYKIQPTDRTAQSILQITSDPDYDQLPQEELDNYQPRDPFQQPVDPDKWPEMYKPKYQIKEQGLFQAAKLAHATYKYFERDIVHLFENIQDDLITELQSERKERAWSDYMGNTYKHSVDKFIQFTFRFAISYLNDQANIEIGLIQTPDPLIYNEYNPDTARQNLHTLDISVFLNKMTYQEHKNELEDANMMMGGAFDFWKTQIDQAIQKFFETDFNNVSDIQGSDYLGG